MITDLIGSFIGTFSAWFVAALWVARKPRRRIPTCAFCNVITKTDEEMQEHIRICPKHPLSQYTAREESK
jgi:hypothetical protein